MDSINFNNFHKTIKTLQKSDFACQTNKIPETLIPILEEKGETFCFLESAITSQTKGLYSILAYGINVKLEGSEILQNIETATEQTKHLTDFNLPMIGAFFGYMSYNNVRYTEPSVHCGNAILIPDGLMFLPKAMIITETRTENIHIVSIHNEAEKGDISRIIETINDAIKSRPKPYAAKQTHELIGYLHENTGFHSNITAEEYKSMVKKSIEYIKKGDIFQIVPSIRFYKKYTKHPLEFYTKLKSVSPSPYMFYLSSVYSDKRYNIIGTSPEILINCEHGEITLRPLAGTIKRGKSEEEDIQNAKTLLADPKEIAEHLMLLDLGRNDVGRIASKVWVEKQMEIEKYSHVMHISSTVKGKIAENKTMLDVLKSGLPAGTLSGAPKIRAMQIIAELETVSRDFYGGALGYISHNVLQTCIVLRSALLIDDTLYTQAGAGVVYDSTPEKEYAECIQKLSAIIAASRF